MGNSKKMGIEKWEFITSFFVVLQVTINQDKASKQIAILRDEITKLTMELIEFRQGKRISSCEGETDVSLENNLLKNENDK